MNNEETIINKQIDIETIIELAKHLESQKEEYMRLINMDEAKNNGKTFNERVYQYKCYSEPEVKYEITFNDNKTVKQSNYNWLIQNLNKPDQIKQINMSFYVCYFDNSINKDNSIQKRLNESIFFYEDRVHLRVDGLELEDEVYKQHSYIIGLLERGNDKYDKTIKNRNLRIQSFCLSIGIILSYIVYLVLSVTKSNLPELFVQLLNNKYGIIIGQWIIAIILGNIFGYGIMMILYRNILPRRKYSYYSRSSHKSVYVDDVDDYKGKCEVHIGKYANSGKNRETIEKIYKITRIFVLIQLGISLILFLVLK